MPLDFRTLGRIELSHADGEPVHTLLAQPKRLVLLAYLCLESRRRPVRRAQLIALFWPDSDEERGRGALRQALHFLRATLGAEAIVRSGDEDLAIDRGLLACDAVALIEQAEREPAAAIDRFHGDFLAGLQLADVAEELEDWLAQTRLALRESALAAAKSLHAAASGAGESSAALYWLRRALALAPDDEGVARSLMELQWKLGDASEALRTFEALKRTLSIELDVAPDARTLALARQIREGRAPPAAPVAVPAGAAGARGTHASDAARDRPVRAAHARSASVAILPFAELGRIDPAGYLGNGLADELHRMLGQCAGYRVASRAVALSAVRTTRDMGTLRTTLDVDWVVDGTVALQDASLEIHARLLELATGRVHGDETFAVARSDVHGASARILPRLFAAAGVEPDADERALLAQQATGDAFAFDAFLQGRHFWRKRPRDSGLALARLREAVERDTSFALAHAALADVYNTLGSWEAAALPSMEAFPKAQDAALAALCIDPRCAEAHTSLAYAAMHYLWQWDAAGRQFRRALELNPHYAHAHHWYSHQLMARGQTAASLESSLRALALDPLDLIINVHLAWHYWLAGDHEQAYEQAQRTARLDERDHWVHFFSGLALSALGEPAKAVDAQRTALLLSANSPVMAAGLGYAYGAAGDRRLARRTLAELPRLAGNVSVAYELAVVAVALGERDAALEHLAEAYRQRSAWLAYVAVDPRLAPLHGDPRFRNLTIAVGVDDVHPAH